jgi:hypothetical protein
VIATEAEVKILATEVPQSHATAILQLARRRP